MKATQYYGVSKKLTLTGHLISIRQVCRNTCVVIHASVYNMNSKNIIDKYALHQTKIVASRRHFYNKTLIKRS